MRRPPARALRLLLGAVGLFVVGVALSGGPQAVGVRLAGAGLLAQAAWLARYDVARRTIRTPGATRYMAAALIAGYVWLAIAGGVWLASGSLSGGGFGYDAMVHAIFLGFVFSMVFAHAPVIVPAVLGVPLPYRRTFYAPLVLLHVGLTMRVLGDAAGAATAWRWGGVLNEVAIVGFLVVAVHAAVRGRATSRARAAGRPARPRPNRAREGLRVP